MLQTLPYPQGLPLLFLLQILEVVCPKVCSCGKVAESRITAKQGHCLGPGISQPRILLSSGTTNDSSGLWQIESIRGATLRNSRGQAVTLLGDVLKIGGNKHGNGCGLLS